MAAVSIFDIFKIGIGPSSSHTVGPMKAAHAFAMQLDAISADIASIEVTLYGSLAYTGRGHGTDAAVVLGLAGLEAETIDPDAVREMLDRIREDKILDVFNVGRVAFDATFPADAGDRASLSRAEDHRSGGHVEGHVSRGF